MLSVDQLWRRANFIVRGQPMFRIHVDGFVGSAGDERNQKACRVGWFINLEQNYRHAFIMTPRFGEECAALLSNGSLVGKLDELVGGIGIEWGNVDPVLHDPGSLENCVFTSKVYIFTDVLERPREFIRAVFKKHDLEAVIVDNERWDRQWNEAKPDAFICHDHRDKTEFADPLYEQLSSMPLKIFYDKYSIRIGDDLVEKIDQGLAECKFAIILVSSKFLENKAWASHEMRALINRQIAEGRKRFVLPVWIDVHSNDVRAKSPMLAKIAARRLADGLEGIAREIHAVISSEK